MSQASFTLGFPRTLTTDDVIRFIRAVAGRPGDHPLLFELRASAGSVNCRIHADESQRRYVQNQLHAHLPSVRLVEDDDAEIRNTISKRRHRLGVELRLSHLRRPLRTDTGEQLAASVLAGLDGLGSGESVQLQWLVGRGLGRSVVRPTPKPDRRSLVDQFVNGPPLDSPAARLLTEKQAEPVVAALGRIVVTANNLGRRRSLVGRVLSGLRLSDRPGVRIMTRSVPSWLVLRRFDRNKAPRFEWPCPLNAAELATLLVWPVGGPTVAGVPYSGRRELPFPAHILRRELPTSTDSTKPLEDRRRLRTLGRATYPGRSGLVQLSAKDTLQHCQIIGPTGVGKSTLLTNLAAQDIRAGRAVVVIEPRGDVVADLLDRIPPERHNNVVLLDPADAAQSVGLNLLSGSTSSVETRVDALVHVFRSLFASSWGPRTQDVLHASLLTLARNPGMTLVEVPALLTDRAFRTRLTKPLLADPAVGSFWVWFEALSDAERSQVIAPVMNKIRAFTMRASVRRIVGQSNPRFSVSDVFTKRRILLVPLKQGEIGPETASLLASLIVAQLWQAAQARSAIGPTHRHPVMLYLDEFQTYLHLSTGLDDVLAQARGLGLGMTLAHQHLGQLTSPAMKSAVLMNARSRVVFQTAQDDARQLSQYLGAGLTADDLTGLDRYEAYARLMSDGSSLRPGSLQTLPLTESLGSANAVRSRSAEQFATSAADVDAAIAERSQRSMQSPKIVGGRRRRVS